MIRGAPATGPPLFLSPEKEGEANMHDHFMSPETDAAKPHERFMYPGTDNDILRVTFSSPCRGVLNTPHKRPGTGRIRAKPHESRIHPKMDDANTRHSFSAENVGGAYSIRPYTGTKMVRVGLRRSFSAENVCRAYSIRPYTGTKMVRAGLRRS